MLTALALATVCIVLSERHGNQNDPWDTSHGWRMNGSLTRTFSFEHEGQQSIVALRYQSGGWQLSMADVQLQLRVNHVSGKELSLQVGTHSVSGTVVRHGEQFHVFVHGAHVELNYVDPLLHAGETEAEAGRLTAPMPGKIVALLVDAGREVKQGEPLLIMEAMKMEHTITAPTAGTVQAFRFALGDQVGDGAELVEFEKATG